MKPAAKQPELYFIAAETSLEPRTIVTGPGFRGMGCGPGPLGGGTQAPDSAHAARATGQWTQSPGRGEVVDIKTNHENKLAAAIAAAFPLFVSPTVTATNISIATDVVVTALAAVSRFAQSFRDGAPIGDDNLLGCSPVVAPAAAAAAAAAAVPAAAAVSAAAAAPLSMLVSRLVHSIR